ncbi:hypothetical protein AB1L42_06715 [Thalassoglobus sp. JC818]|uniref:hypothetical protein n=1 Tax=Thalassoglobus sp. JC818 TaxID=3232136 RepID=UPI00345A9063
MRKFRNQHLSYSRRGSLIPAVAVAIVVFGGAMALVLNRFWISIGQEELETVVQSAALSAATQLASDDLLRDRFDDRWHIERLNVIRENVEEFVSADRVMGKQPVIPQVSGIEFGRLVSSSLTGQVNFLQTNAFPNTVLVTGVCRESDRNSVSLLMPFLTGRSKADLLKRAEASIRNDIVGLRPFVDVGIPMWPLGLLNDDEVEQVFSLESGSASSRLEDQYSWDSATGSVLNEPDGLPEIVVEFHSDPALATGCVIELGNRLESATVQIQIEFGITASQLENSGGWIDFQQFPVSKNCGWTIDQGVFDRLKSKIGQARIVGLCTATAEEAETSQQAEVVGTAVLKRLVGARLMSVQQTSTSTIAVFQEAVVCTRTAVPAGSGSPAFSELSFTENAGLHPYIYRVELTRHVDAGLSY